MPSIPAQHLTLLLQASLGTCMCASACCWGWSEGHVLPNRHKPCNQSVQSACLNRRKYALLGESEADAARIDMLVDGVEDIKRK